ncbi:MAG: MotA/TolQ/ExbB proton channel family protein [Parvibaculales bacterium]
MKNLFSTIAIIAALLLPFSAGAQNKTDDKKDVISLEQLLELVRQGRVSDNQEWAQREAEFLGNKNRQQGLLDKVQADVAREEARSERLEKVFNENELKLAELEALLNDRLGAFGELFGVVRQVAGEMKAQVHNSIISAELKGRDEPLGKLAKTKGLPELKQLEYLWFVLQQEMTAQGQISSFDAEIIGIDGKKRQSKVTRIGPFTTLEGGHFLRFLPDTHQFGDLARQPLARYVSAAEDFAKASPDEWTTGVIDPSRGAILDLLLQTPTLLERVHQGGVVGYIIILLGLFGALVAIQRMMILRRILSKLRKQLSSGDISGNDTPLGRIWAAYQANKTADVETLELKLDDAILKEQPALELRLNTIKILAGITPLMGLLGTVIGMILTFQAITLFGTGDPKLMAGGISQALVTTVLGLVTAIPLLLLHAAAAGMSREIQQVLEEQSVGLIAAHAEKK